MPIFYSTKSKASNSGVSSCSYVSSSSHVSSSSANLIESQGLSKARNLTTAKNSQSLFMITSVFSLALFSAMLVTKPSLAVTESNSLSQNIESTQNVQTLSTGLPIIPVKATIQDFAPKAGFADLIEQISPAVVHVAISGTPKNTLPEGFNFPPGSPFEEFFKQMPRQQEQKKQRKRRLGIGSGFVISADGYVVTNNHVVDGGDDITVTLADGEEYDAKLVGTDEETDLAVLKIDANKTLPFVKWGDDKQSRVGDWVIAIGHPFGLEGGASASTGIVSALGRNISSGRYDNYIQSDAAINRGNSGGPLFNLDGEVIGVNTAILSPSGGSVGVGFSIASSLASSVVTQLKDKGEVERGVIGVQIAPVDDATAESLGRDNKRGALVERVVPDKPADKAGIKPGDIILEFNGQEIVEMRNLPRIVAGTEVGKRVSVKLWRDGKEVTKKIKVDRLSQDTFAANSESGANSNDESDSETIEEFGMELVELNAISREQYGIEDGVRGLLVLSLDRGGLAVENKLREGDIILKVGKQPTANIKAFKEAIEGAKEAGFKSTAVFISRDGETRFRAFRLE
jgi:serine protease Do